jgi:hypothetical protein
MRKVFAGNASELKFHAKAQREDAKVQKIFFAS